MNKFFGIALSVFLIATLPLSFMGIIQQFLGTTFEKYVMGIVTIIGFCADTRIAFEKRWSSNLAASVLSNRYKSAL